MKKTGDSKSKIEDSFITLIKSNPEMAEIIENEVQRRNNISNECQFKLAEEEIEKLTKTFNEVHIKLDNYARELEREVELRTKTINEQQMTLAMTSKLAALGEMAGGIAHEINNPLTIISATCTFLKKTIEKGKFNPEIAIKRLEEMEKTVLRISKIILGLKTLSRDASNEEFNCVKVRDLIEEVISLCTEKFKNHGVKLIIDLNDPIFDMMIECRHIQLSQTFINLFGNAYDAVEHLPEKWVKFECKNFNGVIEFRIIDSGSGIPMEIQEKIFQPFFTTKGIGKGTGLGLSISNSIIKNHNGCFSIDNDHKNTCFVITLPQAKKAA